MEKLPEFAARLIYEYDNTYREQLDEVIWELKNKTQEVRAHKMTYDRDSDATLYETEYYIYTIGLRRNK